MNYSTLITRPDGGEIIYAKGAKHEGWLRSDRDKHFWSVHQFLEDAQLGERPIVEWVYDDAYECFEEAVIEHWFEAGELV